MKTKERKLQHLGKEKPCNCGMGRFFGVRCLTLWELILIETFDPTPLFISDLGCSFHSGLYLESVSFLVLPVDTPSSYEGLLVL